MPTLDKQLQRLVNKARTLGGKGLPIRLNDNELMRICAVVAADLDRADLVGDIARGEELAHGYYGISLNWFQLPTAAHFTFEEVFLSLHTTIQDFATYFENLCAIHKRRRKYKLILEHQALPRMEQIVPRSLLEFGRVRVETLASWLVWRKWLYDLDNRSAQETGYLFEPLLASSIGGQSYSAKTSPIRRTDDSRKGRQVDCIEGNTAYEFKMRVTIAASGQGRFQEELDFAKDCFTSRYDSVH